MSYNITVDLTKEQAVELKIAAIREGKTAKQLIKELIISKLEDK